MGISYLDATRNVFPKSRGELKPPQHPPPPMNTPLSVLMTKPASANFEADGLRNSSATSTWPFPLRRPPVSRRRRRRRWRTRRTEQDLLRGAHLRGAHLRVLRMHERQADAPHALLEQRRDLALSERVHQFLGRVLGRYQFDAVDELVQFLRTHAEDRVENGSCTRRPVSGRTGKGVRVVGGVGRCETIVSTCERKRKD